MRRALKRFYAVAAVAIAAGLLVTLSLVQPVLGTRADFSIYNTRWNGASGLAAELYGGGALLPSYSVSLEDEEVTIVQRSFAEFDLEPAATSLVLLGPAAPPTPEEAEWLRGFVHGGGRLLLADDFGAGNAFLAAVGAASRFDGGLLMDLSFAREPSFVVAASIEPHPVTNGAREAVLDVPTALIPAADALVLARSGGSAWLDLDGDGVPGRDDPRGAFPWLALERVGEGAVLLLSDPSLLINGMREPADNARIAAGVVAWLTEDARRVLVDESHRDIADPLKLAGATLRRVPPVLRVGLALAASGVFLLMALKPPGRRLLRSPAWVSRVAGRLLPPEPEPERDVVAKVLERHPEWDENALRAMLTARGKT